jgi:hypothetical protein
LNGKSFNIPNVTMEEIFSIIIIFIVFEPKTINEERKALTLIAAYKIIMKKYCIT